MSKGRKAFIFLVIAEIIILLMVGIKIKKDIARVDAQLDKIKKEIRQLEKENRKLREMKKKALDPFFIEKIARDELGLARKGEIIYWIASKRSSAG